MSSNEMKRVYTGREGFGFARVLATTTVISPCCGLRGEGKTPCEAKHSDHPRLKCSTFHVHDISTRRTHSANLFCLSVPQSGIWTVPAISLSSKTILRSLLRTSVPATPWGICHGNRPYVWHNQVANTKQLRANRHYHSVSSQECSHQ